MLAPSSKYFKALLCLLFALLQVYSYGQKIGTFQKCFGGTNEDMAAAIVALPDKGFITIGLTNSYGAGGYDLLVIRTDSMGKKLWAKTYGGSSDEGVSLYYIGRTADAVLSPDTCVVICTDTKSYGKGGSDIYFLKIDLNGNLKWAKTYGSANDDFGIGVSNDPNSGFFLVGEYGSTSSAGTGDLLVIKTDTGGSVVWSNTYGNSSYEEAGYKIIPTLDGNFLVGGYLYNPSTNYNQIILKIDKTGKLLWNSVYGAGTYTLFNGIAELPDKSIYTGGYYYNGSNNIPLLAKFDNGGKRLWSNLYSSTSLGNSTLRTILYDKNKNVLNVAAGGSISSLQRAYVIRFDTSGALKFFKHYGPASTSKGYTSPTSHEFLSLPSGGFVMIASTLAFGFGNNDVYILKMDSAANPNSCYVNTASLSPTSIFLTNRSYSISTTSISPSVSNGAQITSPTVAESLVCAPFNSDFRWLNACSGQLTQFYDSSYYKPTSWKWNFGDSSSSSNKSTSQNPTHTYTSSGSYTVKLVSSNGTVTDSVTKTIIVKTPPKQVNRKDTTICLGDSARIYASAGSTYQWSLGSYVNDSTSATTWAHPYQTTIFIATVGNSTGCYAYDTFNVKIDTSVSKCGKPTSISGVINTYSQVTKIDTCRWALTVGGGVAYKVGQKILIIQMQGAIIDSSATSTFGSIKNISVAGNYEYGTIDSIAGTILFLKNPLLKSYNTAADVQVVSVPQYTDVQITGTLKASAWDGKKGGVLIFEATGNVYAASNIDASATGFTGSTPSYNTGSCHSNGYYYSSLSNGGNSKGYGIAVSSKNYPYGRGSNANGGGGGDDVDAGGGGGSNYGIGGIGGKEWDYTCSSPIANGGIGGISLSTYESSKLFMGGQGGSGSNYTDYATAGVAGGGIVIIKAKNIYAGSGKSVMSNGGDQTTSSQYDAGGGGGGGGSVAITSTNIYGTLKVSVRGGNGGSANASHCNGPGGGGGGGTIYYSQTSTRIKTSNVLSGGLPGTNVNSSSSCYKSSNGADSGRVGGIIIGFSVPANTVINTRTKVTMITKYKKICAGDSIQLSASGASKYAWSPSASLSDSTVYNPWAYPVVKTIYTVSAINSRGCLSTDTVTINVDTSCFKGKKISGVINKYAAVSAFDTCYNALTVDNTSYFSVGDKVLLIQMKGALVDTSNTSSFGSIKSINSAGAYEYVTIDSIGGSTLYLKYKTLRKYNASAGLQLVTVPQYSNVFIFGVLKPAAWDGSKGGVLIFEASGKVTLAADIDASSTGFLGGAKSTAAYSCGKADYYYNNSSGDGANKGEGIVVTHTGWTRGRGPAANGGGGGNSVDAGGGGGGNYNAGGIGGKQLKFCTGSATNWGLGGIALKTYYDSGRLFLGGGGGCGHNYYTSTLPGVAGGGIIMIKSTSMSGEGFTIKSNGSDQSGTPTMFGDAAGGGGAAGSVLLDIPNYSTPVKTILKGGKGGNVDNYDCVGPGGGGSGGALLSTAGKISSLINFSARGGFPGINITTYNSNGCAGSAYGADTGKNGGTSSGIAPITQGTIAVKRPVGKVANKSMALCNGDSIQLIASGGVKYVWYPGKTLSDSTIRTPWAKPTAKTTYHVRIFAVNGCYKEDTVTIFTTKGPVVTAPKLTCVSTSGSGTTPSVTLSWSFSPADTNLSGFNIYRSYGDTTHFAKIITINSPKTTTYLDAGVSRTDSGIYYYRIYGLNKCPVQGKASNILNTIVLSYKKIGDKKVQLSWNTPLSADKRKYFQVQSFDGTIYTLIDSTKSNTYMLSGCMLTDKYVVSIKDSFNTCNDYSNVVDPQQKDITPPSPPRILVSSVISNQMVITYYASDSSDVNYHYLYRSVDGGAYSKIATLSALVPGTQYKYKDNSAGMDPQSHTYTYRMNADDICSNISAWSSAHKEVQLDGSVNALAVSLHWTNYLGFNYDTIWIERAVPSGYYSPGSGTPSGYAFSKLVTLTKNDSSYSDNVSSHYCNVPVYYRIVTRKKGTNEVSYSDSITFTPADTAIPTQMQINYVCINYGKGSANYGSPIVNFKAPKSLNRLYEYILFTGKGQSPAMKSTLVYKITGTGTTQLPGDGLYSPFKDTISYVLYAMDSCGNLSPASQRITPPYLSGMNGEISNTLQWNKFAGDKVLYYRLLANYGSGVYQLVDTIPATDSMYVHKNLHCYKRITYYIQTVAQNGTSCSDTISLTPYDTISPQKVNTISASVTDKSHIRVTFNKVADPDVIDYLIYRSQNNGTFSKVGNIGRPAGSPVSFMDFVNTLTDTFSYKVIAVDSCGNQSKAAIIHRAVQLNGKALDDSSYLSWSAYQGFTVKNYTVQTWTNASGWIDTYTGILPTTTAFMAPGSCNVTFNYRIKAIEDGGNNAIAYSDSIAIKPYDTISPQKPSITFISVLSNSSIQINWKKSVSADVKNYNLFRQNSSGTWIKIDSLGNVDTFTDTGVDTRKSYCYAVQAQDSCASNVSGLSPPHCSIALNTAAKGCEKSIYLTWNKYSGWDSVKKYDIYRSVNGGIENLLTTVSSATTTFRDSLLNYHNKYCYRILAHDYNATLSWSNTSCNQVFFIDTPTVLAATKISTSTTNGTVVVRWKSINTPHLAYNQLYYSSDGSSYSLLKNNIPPTQDTFAHSGLNTETADHYYYLVTVDSCNAKSDQSSHHKTMDLTVSVGQLLHKLNWTPYKGFKIKTYRIGKLLSGKFRIIDSVPATDTFSRFFPAPCNSVERYRIEAAGFKPGEIAWSDTMGRQAIDTEPSNRAIIGNATVTSGISTKINFRGSDSLDTYDYVVQRSTDGKWSTAGEVIFNGPGKQITYADTGINTQNNHYCYTVLVRDSCLNTTLTDTFCVIQLKGKPQNLADSLKWYSFKGYGIDKYLILTYNSTGKWDTLAKVTGIDTQYFHQPLPCNVPVTYKIQAFEKGGTRITLSDSITLVPFDTIKPPAPVIKYATVLDGNRIKLFWHKSINKVKLYELSMKSGNGSWNVIANINIDTSYTFTGLNTPDSIYDFRIVAIDSCSANRSANSQFHSPVQLGGKGQNLSNLLQWKKYEGFSPVQKYYIYRWKNGWQLHDSVGGNILSYLDTGLSCNVPKFYRVSALDNTGQYLSQSDTIQLTPFDTIKPPAPTIRYATVVNGSRIELFWNKSIPKVRLYELSMKSGNGSWNVVDTTKDITQYIFKGLNTPDSIYDFRVVAIDSCAANRSPNSMMHSPVQLDGKGQNLSNLLQWKKYEGFSSVSKYYIYLWKNSWQLLDSVNGNTLTYLHKFLPCNVPQYYRIGALDNSGQYLSQSDTIQLTPFDTIKPPAPTIRYATVLDGSRIELFWNKSIPKVRLYELSMKSGNGSWNVIDTTKDITQYIFKGLNTPDSIYDFRVVAIDSCAANRSPNSMMHSPVQLDGKGQNLSNLLQWKKYEGFSSVSKYYIYLWKNSWQLLDSVNGTTLTYLHKFLSCNVPQYYRIGALDNLGQYLSQSDTIQLTPFDTIKPPAPTIKYATVLNGSRIELFWNKSIPKVRLYELSMKSGNGSWNVIDTTKDITQYIFKGLNTPDSIYDFRVVAIDSCAANRSINSMMHSPVQLDGLPMDDTVMLFWKKYEGFGVKKYYVYNLRGGLWKVLDSVSGNTLQYFHKTIPCNEAQFYRVGAMDSSGNYLSQSDTIQLVPYDTIKPKAPKLYFATVLPDQTVKLGWEWNPKSDVKYFEIWRNDAKGPDKLLDTVVYDSTFIDKTAKPGVNHYAYYVIAIDSCNKANRSPSSHHDTLMNLALESYFCTPKVQINWNLYKGLPDNADRYDVYRSADGVNFNGIATLPGPAVKLADTLVNYGKRYYYKVRAIDTKTGYNSFSDTLSTVPRIIPNADTARMVYTSVSKTGVTDGAVYIQWNRARLTDTNARGYFIYLFDSVSGKYVLLHDEKNLNTTNYTHRNINTQYRSFKYYVITYNSCNLGIGSKSHKTILLKIKEQNLASQLSWTNYLGTGVKNYSVYKSVDGGIPYLFSNSGLDSTLTDTNVFCHHIYTYQVRATLANGKVSSSDSVSVTAFDTTAPASSFIYVASVASTSKTAGKIDLYFWGNKTKNRSGYNIYRALSNGNFKLVSTLNTTKTDTIYWQDGGLNTIDSIYRYKIGAIDSCGNEALPIDTHQVVHLKVKALNKAMKIDWTHYKGWKNLKYVLEKSRNGTTWTAFKNFDSTKTGYIDSNVTCHVVYYYRIRVIDLDNNLVSYSNTRRDSAFNNDIPTTMPMSLATVIKTGISNGKIYLEWNASPAKNLQGYNIYRSDNGTSWKELEHQYPALFYTDSNLNTHGQPYYYKIQPIDSCGNLGPFTLVHKTMKVKALPGNQKVQIAWNSYQGWKVKKYMVYRDGILIGSFGKDTTNYIDTSVLCTRTYQYLVKAVCDTIADTLVSMSNTDSARPFDNIAPAGVYIKTVTVSDPNKIATITWTPSASFDTKNYYIYRKSGINQNMVLVDSTDQTTYSDNIGSIIEASKIHGSDICYYVFARDHCRNQSQGSNKGCIILLNAANGPGYNNLEWKGYEHWNDGAQSYNVYKNEDNQGWNLIGTTTSNSINKFTDKNLGDSTISFCYQVEAVENPGQYNQLSRSTVECVHQDATVFIPNTFSHYNIDGLNDKFGPKGLHIKNYRMQVYNRWGELVYNTSTGQDWDGTFQGADALEGVYLYIITIEDYNGHENMFKGTITIFH
jgi:gliding motility-associated-like protein